MSDWRSGWTVVVGNSMRPLLKSGDVISMEPVAREELHKGDVIVFTALDGVKTIHRVIALQPLITQGDNRLTADLPVPEDSLIFRCTHYVRNGKESALAGGRRGQREFFGHQLRMNALNFLRKILTPLAHRRWGKIAFSALHPLFLEDLIVCCFGKYPVGWCSQKSWHWKRFWRLAVHAPTSEELLALETERRKRVGKR